MLQKSDILILDIIFIQQQQMDKLVLFSILVLLFTQIQAQANSAVFAFSWYQGHCLNIGTGGCDPSKLKLWDHQSFTIHGLWVKAKATKNYGEFDLSIIQEDEQLLDDMNNYWPPQSRYPEGKQGESTFLWSWQWQRHGHDYAELIKKLHPQQYAGQESEVNRKLQKAFFHDTIAFYKSIEGVQKYPKDHFTRSGIAEVFDLQENQLQLVCVRGDIIRQIKVCFDLTAKGPVFIKCNNLVQGCKKRTTHFKLPSWDDQWDQKRVVDYPEEY